MAKFLKNGNMLRVAEIDNTFETLPMGVYNLGLDQKGFFLTRINDFKLPEKIYGDTSVVDRWLTTYNDKKRNVGVLLSGLKGGGKTITAKLLAIKSKKPVICINEPYSGSDFADFITDPILGDCVIFIDEFEKTYPGQEIEYEERREFQGNASLLSLLDGPYETHHLFVFTVNQFKINTNLINRPSRILYAKKYEGLSEEEILEIANDKLIHKQFLEDLLKTSKRIFQLSYDILISIIDEVNRFKEPASKCIEYMNLTPMNIRFDCEQWFIDDDGKVDSTYGCYGNEVEHDGESMTLSTRFNYEMIFEGFEGDEEISKRNTSVDIDMSNAKKVAHNTYEVFDDELKTLFVLTETNNNSYYHGYGLGNNYKPTTVQYEKLKIYIDKNKNYVKHIPEEISIETIKEIIGTRWFSKKEKEKEDSFSINQEPINQEPWDNMEKYCSNG